LILEDEDAMFTGDNVLGQGTAVFEDLAAYLKSLNKMSALFSGRAYPGHGPVIDDGKAKILEYIRHRQQREDQVLDVLRSPRTSTDPATSSEDLEKWTSMEIVKVIYKDVPESLHVPANGGVVQVLWKLKQEGKVLEDSSTEKWSIKKGSTL
jgi:ribonuclease/clavin/mitogillin